MFAHTTHVLIDPRSTHLFMSYAYAKHASSSPVILDYVLHVFTPLRNSLLSNLVLKSSVIMIANLELLTNLILLDMEDFDVIFGWIG